MQITDRSHILYELVSRLRASREPEEVKKQQFFDGVFEMAKSENPWLKNRSIDELKKCFDVTVPERPEREDTVGEKSRAAYETELDAEKHNFFDAFGTLRDIMRDYDKAHPDDPKTEIEKKLDKFWNKFWTVDNATGSSDPYDCINEIRDALTPKSPFGSNERPVSEADKLLDLFFDYLQEAHSDQDPAKIVPTEEENRVLNLLYRGISGMTRYADMLEEATSGTLEIPPAGQETEDDKKIHRVNAVGKEPNLTDEIISGRNVNAGYQMNFLNVRFQPLFRFSPKPSDVMQGGLGDCYFVASLATIAAQNPSLIRNAMKDNRDGTVTVRFFTKEREPVYVTVDKSVPRTNGRDPYAKNDGSSLWVQIMEKAYVQSGLKVKGGLEKAEAGTFTACYKDIEGGHEWEAISAVIGTGYTLFDETNRFLDIPAPGKDGYSKAETDFVNTLKTELANGQFLTAAFSGTRQGLFGTPLDGRHSTVSGIDSKEAGMYTRHTYSLHAVEEENGRYYITVRNPHAHGGINSLEDGELIAKDRNTAAGYSRLELRDFGAYFNYVNINSIDLSPTTEERLPEAKNIVRLYGDAVRKIAGTVKDTDSALMYFKNSDEFRAFRDAAIALDREMQRKVPSESRLNDGLEKLFQKAKAYADHCENDKKISVFKDSNRAQRRYQAAKIALEMNFVYEANSGKTLRDKFEEFSYRAAEQKVGIPVTSEALLGVYQKAADNMAKRFLSREGDFEDKEARNRLYRFLEGFAEDNSAKTLNGKLAAQKTDGERFDCLRDNARTVCTMHFIRRYGEEVLRAMESDGVSLKNGSLRIMLLTGEGTELMKNRLNQKDNALKNSESGITL